MEVFGVASGLVAIVALIGLFWRFVRTVRAKLVDFEDIVPMLRDMAHEFGPNTGNSLRDRINAIERVQDMQSQVLATHARELARSVDSINNLHVRLDQVVEEVISRLDRRRREGLGS